jgi:3-deoxy-D-manno-octulosonate 8-phosphate phosphatase (KDO 8-P phosphatase)
MADCPTGGSDNFSAYPSDCDVTAGLREMANNRVQQTIDQRLVARAKEIRLLLLDVDGVLTDGTLLFAPDGSESKAFNTQDGFGIRLLQEAGLDVGVITARSSAAVSARCENLKMRYTYQGESDKLKAYNDILRQSGRKPVEICYMGDDWLDLILLKRVGFSAAPANAVAEVQRHVHYTTSRRGGDGAVREVCDVILQARGVHHQLLQTYMNR